MIAALGAVLPIAVGGMLASLPVVAMAAVLGTIAGRGVLRRFTLGWLVGMLAVGTLGLLLADVVTLASDSAAWLAWLRIALGVALIALAARAFVRRPRGDAARASPKWMTTLEGMEAGRAFRMAFLLGSVNPKNVVIVLSGVATIVAQTGDVGTQFAVLLVFVLVASLGVLAPLAALTLLGDRAARPLERFVGWFAHNSQVVLASVILLLGVVVLSGGLAALG
ncbi:GAP family protein [Arthrobacter sp. L77]|uniref:GAP family protein n=1 Tax=Arthrobacter sp. L77 TaxID=1496689 RepID=UPI0005B7EEC5|nr:GAP family protein [Arthrobacter sp. L77]